MTAIRMYLLGNRLSWLPACFGILTVFSYRFWYAAVGDRCGVAVQELAGVVFSTIAAWQLHPRMGTWSALGTSRLRRTQASAALLVLVLASASPFITWRVLAAVPTWLVPGHASYDPAEVTVLQVSTIAANVSIVSGVILVAVAVLGRPVGAAVGLMFYGVGFALSPRLDGLGYHALCADLPSSAGWPGAVIVVCGAVAVWLRTAGTTRLARLYFDA